MQLRTHLALGLLFGVLLFYFYNFGGTFVLLTGIVSLLPDIDWVMQFKWGLGNRHRTFMHNIWAMSAVIGVAYYLGSDPITLIAIAVGYAGHLLADSLTVTGISWLYPYEGGMRLQGPINMSNGRERLLERLIQSLLFSITAIMLLSKRMALDPFSLEGIMAMAALIPLCYVLMVKFDKATR